MAKKNKIRLAEKLPEWSHTPATIILRSAISAIQVFGLEATLDEMDRLGRGYAKAPWNKRQLKRCKKRIRFAFPDWDEDRVDHVAAGVWGHLFQLGAETLYTPRFLSHDSWVRHACFGKASQAFGEILTNQPVILVTGHFGNWELSGYAMAVMGVPVHAVYRPFDLKPIDNWMKEVRGKRGMQPRRQVRRGPRAAHRAGQRRHARLRRRPERGRPRPVRALLRQAHQHI